MYIYFPEHVEAILERDISRLEQDITNLEYGILNHTTPTQSDITNLEQTQEPNQQLAICDSDITHSEIDINKLDLDDITSDINKLESNAAHSQSVQDDDSSLDVTSSMIDHDITSGLDYNGHGLIEQVDITSSNADITTLDRDRTPGADDLDVAMCASSTIISSIQNASSLGPDITCSNGDITNCEGDSQDMVTESHLDHKQGDLIIS